LKMAEFLELFAEEERDVRDVNRGFGVMTLGRALPKTKYDEVFALQQDEEDFDVKTYNQVCHNIDKVCLAEYRIRASEKVKDDYGKNDCWWYC